MLYLSSRLNYLATKQSQKTKKISSKFMAQESSIFNVIFLYICFGEIQSFLTKDMLKI